MADFEAMVRPTPDGGTEIIIRRIVGQLRFAAALDETAVRRAVEVWLGQHGEVDARLEVEMDAA